MGENTRVCHAVGLDAHGLIFEREAEGAEKNPVRIMEAAQQHAADCCMEAVRNVLGLPIAPIAKEDYWRKEQWAMLQLQREIDLDSNLRQRDFVTEANKRILKLLFPDMAASDEQWCALAKEMRRLRRRDKVPYVIYDFTRRFLEWLKTQKNVIFFLETGSERRRIKELMEQQEVSPELFHYIFCAEDLGTSKLSSDFWGRILERLNLAPAQIVNVGNSVLFDAACTRYGIPAIIIDRSGCKEEFYRARGETYYGVRLLHFGDDFPPRAPFIAFAKDHRQIQEWLERMLIEK